MSEDRKKYRIELARRIGARLREARMARGLTQEQVAESIRVSTEFYRRMESGRALPSVRTLRRLVRCLQVSADYLLARDERRPESEQTRMLLEMINGLLRASPAVQQQVFARVLDWEAQVYAPRG